MSNVPGYYRRKKDAIRAFLNGEKHLVEVWPDLARKPWHACT